MQQLTIKPLIQKAIALDSLIYTDESAIYKGLKQWGYKHITVCHGNGEYARDEDGDGFHEVHVNRIEGFGHSCALGLDHIEAFLKINFLFI